MTQLSAAGAGAVAIGGDLVVNRLGFGAMRLCGPGIWGEPEDAAAARALLRRAVEPGVNLIDTADVYGPEVNERQIADAFYPYQQGRVGRRAGRTTSGREDSPHRRLQRRTPISWRVPVEWRRSSPSGTLTTSPIGAGTTCCRCVSPAAFTLDDDDVAALDA